MAADAGAGGDWRGVFLHGAGVVSAAFVGLMGGIDRDPLCRGCTHTANEVAQRSTLAATHFLIIALMIRSGS